MQFNARGGISILQLGAFLPGLVIAAIVCWRHGFTRSTGWVFTLVLCVVRILGACCQLATYQKETKGLFEATIILDTIGLSPLLFATLGLLSRCLDSIHQVHKTFLTVAYIRIIQLIITLGLILSIVGGTSSISSTGVVTIQTTSKAGAILYVVSYIALGLVTCVTATNLSHITSGEGRLAWAVMAAMPFILVRLVYTLLNIFHHDKTFNILDGSVLVLALMAVLEEIIVTFLYLLLGLITKALPKTVQGPIASRPWRGNRGYPPPNSGTPSSHVRMPKRQGPIHTLVGMAMAAREENRDSGAVV